MTDFSNSVSNRFLRYTSFDTMSLSEEAGSRRPTSPGQLVMLEELLHELEAMGVECGLTPECVVHGILKENVQGVPAIAFMAHVDTSDAVMGNGVKAVRRVYTGGDIVLKNGNIKGIVPKTWLPNYNEFYDWQGPDYTISLPTFRVDSPMKGDVSAGNETELSFLLISADTDKGSMTVREVLWNTDASDTISWGQTRTVSLKGAEK